MSAQESHAEGDRIGDCYLIEAELGHGGMARVYRVLDERSGERFALKRLVAAGDQRATLQNMFEHEYHTLVQLAHPRIVRAVDYGVDGDSPYYTMELLEGTDVRGASRGQALPVRDVCLLLRDAASALALIHSRRLVHRDVSPRNLWRTAEGRGKLIDFGTLVAMGPQTRVAGTAPFVPPEAMYAQPLDARCDLYGLGALAYYLLTKRNAYPAREIADLRQVWRRRPPRPDAINSEIPRALGDLVMALLSLDARGRPASAAEVVERLTVLGGLPAEDERNLAQSFLTSPTLVGRSFATAALRKRLLRARRGRCTAATIVAPAGLGRSRMLASSVLDAKLMGAVAVSLDAGAAGSGSFALVTALAERLLEAAPPLAHEVSVSVAGLGYASPALHRALGQPALPELRQFELGRKLASAFVTLVTAISRDHHLLIAIDDVQRSDAASLGLLARIAELPGAQRLLLLTTCDEAALLQPSPLLEQLVKPQARLELTPLGADDTRALLGSLFGEVAGLDAAAAWLHELSQGSPQTCMQYAQYLVEHGLARYEAGHWRFPERLRDQALPPTLGNMLEGRLAEWSEDARALALGLALARDESRSVWQPENHVLLEDYPRLLEDSDAAYDPRATTGAARAFAALDELVRAGMLRQHDDSYVLGQRAMVDALLRLSSPDERQRMHRRLAHVFERGAYKVQGYIATVRHLQRAGEHERARKALKRFTAQLGGSAAMDWGAMRVSVSAECTRVALQHWQAHGGSPLEGILLRRMLLLTSSVYDWRQAGCADAQLTQLCSDIGLQHWDATDSALPAEQRARECMQRAQATYEAKPEAERGLDPEAAVRELAVAAISVYGAFVNSHDVAASRRLPPVLERLRTVSPAVDVIHEMCVIGVARVTGHDVADLMIGSAQKLIAGIGLPDVLQQGGAGINAYMQAIEDLRRGRSRANTLVDLLVPSVGEEMFLVAHIRWLCHAFRGRADRAAHYRKLAEVITEDDIWRRKAALFAEAELYALTGDLPGLKRTSEAIARVAADFPGWQPWLSWTRAILHRLHGELDAAQTECARALELAPVGEHRAWVRIAPAHAEISFLRGDVDSAQRQATAIVEAVDTRGLDPLAALAAERLLALCASKQGDHLAARAMIERAFARAHTLECDGLPLAQLYEAQGRLLLAAGAARECAAALASLRELIQHADAPLLIHAYEALRAENSQVAIPELSTSIAPTRHAVTEASQLWTEVQVRLNAHDQRAARAQQALAMLLEDSGAATGHLFLFDVGGLFVAASNVGDAASDRLLSIAQRHLDSEMSKTSSDAVTVAVPLVSLLTRSANTTHAPELMPVLLTDDAGGRAVVTGMALLVMQGAVERMPRIDLVRAISRCLEATGDSVPLPLDA